jgi:hypothetical protein
MEQHERGVGRQFMSSSEDGQSNGIQQITKLCPAVLAHSVLSRLAEELLQ